jgi:DNA-binding HxlR family transcriptional regulator
MATKRTYGERCAASHALDLVGERWALLVVRELLLGPKRFTDLRTGIVHASPNVLAQRLRELEEAGIVRRRKLAPPVSTRVYELTEWGLELEPVILDLGRWGGRSPTLDRDADMSVDSHILAMRAMFDPNEAADLEATYELRLGDDRFSVRIADGRIEAVRGELSDADATVTADSATWGSVLWDGRDLAEAVASGELRVEGDQELVERLLGLFPLPEPFEPALA